MRSKRRLLIDVMISRRFEEKVIKLVDVPNLCGRFKDGALRACDVL